MKGKRLVAYQPEHRSCSKTQKLVRTGRLFLFLNMHRVLTQSWAVLLQAKFLAAQLTTQCVIVVPGLFTHEKNGFHFLLPFSTRFLSHRKVSTADKTVQFVPRYCETEESAIYRVERPIYSKPGILRPFELLIQ